MEPSTAPTISLINTTFVPSSFSNAPSMVPTITLPSLNFTGQCRTYDRPCQLCEGDCESDIDCAEGKHPVIFDLQFMTTALLCLKFISYDSYTTCTSFSKTP
jgi:hypothetical protein